ncbi:hypothetical protein IL306_003179 [Fusarium sp. DS 682]|nr:hypothetical protein IL306_003179 [Fusarium sp. DS 682]
MYHQTFRDVSPPEARPSTRLGFFRAATPMFGRSSTPSTRPASSMMQRRAEGKRINLLSLLSRKRKIKVKEEIPREPANWQATRIGAHRYIECSAATGEGMKEVIDDSAREAMRRLGGGQVPEDEVVVPKKKRRFF